MELLCNLIWDFEFMGLLDANVLANMSMRKE